MVQKLDALTSLRFFAAGAIVLHHISGTMGIPRIEGYNLAQGVSFFFVLSGFILLYVYPHLESLVLYAGSFWLASAAFGQRILLA